MFLLLVIYCCNKASNRIVPKQKDLVFYSWITLSAEVSRLSPYTHVQQHTQTSRTFYIFATHLADIPLHWWRIRCPVEGGETNSGSSVADCIHTAIFQNIHENRIPSNVNRIQGRVYTHTDLRSTSTKKNRSVKVTNILNVQNNSK